MFIKQLVSFTLRAMPVYSTSRCRQKKHTHNLKFLHRLKLKISENQPRGSLWFCQLLYERLLVLASFFLKIKILYIHLLTLSDSKLYLKRTLSRASYSKIEKEKCAFTWLEAYPGCQRNFSRFTAWAEDAAALSSAAQGSSARMAFSWALEYSLWHPE